MSFKDNQDYIKQLMLIRKGIDEEIASLRNVNRLLINRKDQEPILTYADRFVENSYIPKRCEHCGSRTHIRRLNGVGQVFYSIHTMRKMRKEAKLAQTK